MVGLGDEIKISIFARFVFAMGRESHLVVGNLTFYTFSDSVYHGGHFDIYLVGLGNEIKISIFGRFGLLGGTWAPPSGWKFKI